MAAARKLAAVFFRACVMSGTHKKENRPGLIDPHYNTIKAAGDEAPYPPLAKKQKNAAAMKPFAPLALLICGINVEANFPPMQHGRYLHGDLFQAGLARQRQMYRIAGSYTASSADAEDAMLEALLCAWSRRDTLRNPAFFSTWLNYNEASHRRGKSKEEAS